MTYVTKPVRDLSEPTIRSIIANEIPVTVKVYDSTETVEPNTTLYGVVNLIGITDEGTVVHFRGTHSALLQPISREEPITITYFDTHA